MFARLICTIYSSTGGGRLQRRNRRQGRKLKPTTIVDEEEIIQPPPTIIFCTRPKAVTYLTYCLKALDIRAIALHSRLTQRERLNSLDLFRASLIPALVSTHVGARGLDIEGVALVVNWICPRNQRSTYIVWHELRELDDLVCLDFLHYRLGSSNLYIL